MISEASKRELKRRQREQIQLLTARIKEHEAWLDANPTKEPDKAFAGVWAHRHTLPNGKIGTWLTQAEMRAHVVARLAELRDGLVIWSKPFDFEQPTTVTIPKPVARAMTRLRKRTRQLLLKQQKKEV